MVTQQTEKLRIIPLGGMREIGKNVTLFEYGDEMVMIDCGLIFPEEQMLGIDLVIPDFTYVVANAQKLKGILITHGHEDHIGALPYALKQFKAPIYGTRLSLGLIQTKLKEHNLVDSTTMNVVQPRDKVQISKHFTAEYIKVSHSVAGACAIALHTPVGTIVHSGDFKIDYTPVDGHMMDFSTLARLGEEGVLMLMCESTNVERPGYTMSERTVGKTFDNIFARADGHRIIIASFASNIHRIQQVVDAAEKYGRKVCFCGRSMLNVMGLALEMGELDVPEGMLVELDDLRNQTQEEMVIITTGSQGEPMSGLARMASMEHRQIEISEGDMVIVSANPIPGNEKFVARMINSLFERGAEVIYEALEDVHVSGHACQEELKQMHALTKPQFFTPVHGEYRHLRQHAQLAMDMGMSGDHIFIMENGAVLETDGTTVDFGESVQAGAVLVDGLGIGDVGNIVLRDRRHLSEDGLVVVVMPLTREGTLGSQPDIISRGFVYVRESETLIDDARTVIRQAVERCVARRATDWATIKSHVKSELSEYLYERTKRKPMILPIVVET